MVCVATPVVVAAVTALVFVDILVDVGRFAPMLRDSWCALTSKWCDGCPFAFPWWMWQVLH